MPLSIQNVSLSTLNHRHVVSSVSTNSELIEAIKTQVLNADDRHLLTAETQTSGRGQHTRSWQSPPGNVYLSLYHPIDIPISGLLSLVIGVELAKMPLIKILNEHLQAQGLTPIGVKWANDLGFYQQQQQNSEVTRNAMNQDKIIAFHKLAGILIEPIWLTGKLQGIVIGVGLNVAATPKLTEQMLEGMNYQALSLQDVYELIVRKQENNDLESLPALEIIYQQITQSLLAAIDCFKNLAAEKATAQSIIPSKVKLAVNTTDSFMQQFNDRDALAGLKIRITQNYNNDEHVISGRACGIDTNGCLQLRQDNGNISAIFTGRIDVIDEA